MVPVQSSQALLLVSCGATLAGEERGGSEALESPWCSACSRRKLKTLFFRSKIAASVGRPKDRGVAKMFLSGPRWWLD